MTTFQEPQPQSRRSVRQSERETPDLKPPFSTTGPVTTTPPQSSTYSAPVTGRRSAQATSAPLAAPEPLMYSTQSRPGETDPPAPTFRPRGAETASSAPQQSYSPPPSQSTQHGEQSAYRARDFSPEGRRAAAPLPSFVPEPEWTHTSPPPTDLHYQTQGRLPNGTPAAPTHVPPAAAEPL